MGGFHTGGYCYMLANGISQLCIDAGDVIYWPWTQHKVLGPTSALVTPRTSCVYTRCQIMTRWVRSQAEVCLIAGPPTAAALSDDVWPKLAKGPRDDVGPKPEDLLLAGVNICCSLTGNYLIFPQSTYNYFSLTTGKWFDPHGHALLNQNRTEDLLLFGVNIWQHTG